MHLKHLAILCVAFALVSGCKSSEKSTTNASESIAVAPKSMRLEAAILSSKTYKNLPSASGIEYVGNAYYVLGDDSPYLYQLDEQYTLQKKYALFDTASFKTGRIPKAIKPDLESMAHFVYGRDEMLLLLGSGGSMPRNKAYLVNLTGKMATKEIDFTRFYTFLKQILKIEAEGVLNIEGLAMDKAYAYLLQRPLGQNSNVLFRFDANDFKDFLLLNGKLPPAAVYHFALPEVGGRPAGFSGAYTLGDKLFFTASVEDTPNAMIDGEVLGSYVGIINLRDLPYASDPAKPMATSLTQLKNPDGSVFTGKAESLVVTEIEKDKKYKVVVVTDDDKGGSGLVEIELEFTL